MKWPVKIQCILISSLFAECNILGVSKCAFSDPERPITSGDQADQSLGESGVIRVSVTSVAGGDICHSFAFSQVPGSEDLFIGKYRRPGRSICGDTVTLALFRLDWHGHLMRLLHPLMDIPANLGSQTLMQAYDPYVAKFAGEYWIGFECTGIHIAGTSACIAPLIAGKDGITGIDVSRLSIPVVGLDNDAKSPYEYSASTPKLLEFGQRFYIYWSSIRIEKASPRKMLSIETRGAELIADKAQGGKLWVKDHLERPLPSHAPGANVAVMSPKATEPSSDTAVDTEGLLAIGGRILILSSVGGSGPEHNAPCVTPHDISPGCFRLVITRADSPLADNAFFKEEVVSPRLPVNPMEYPRFVSGPDHQVYILVQSHPLHVEPASQPIETIEEGLILIPLAVDSLRFESFH